MSAEGERRGRAALCGLAGVALWTVVVAYLLPPERGSSLLRLALYLAGAGAGFWAGWRLFQALAPPRR